MDRYSCNFSGKCEEDASSPYTQQECEAGCESMSSKDIVYLTQSFSPDPTIMAPSDAVRVVRDITGVVVAKEKAKSILQSLADMDLKTLVEEPSLHDWILQQQGKEKAAFVHNLIPARLIDDITGELMEDTDILEELEIGWEKDLILLDLLHEDVVMEDTEGPEDVRTMLDTFLKRQVEEGEQDVAMGGEGYSFIVTLYAGYTFYDVLKAGRAFGMKDLIVKDGEYYFP